MIKEFILERIAEGVLDSVKLTLKNTKIRTYSNYNDVVDALNQHLTFVRQWSSEVNFSDLKHSKSTKKVYVDLDLYFQPIRTKMKNEKSEKIELKEIFNNDTKHIALLGQVGSGKTTSLKYICQSLLFNEDYFESELCYPIVIKLNDYNSLAKDNEYSKSIIFNALIKILGINFDFQNLDERAIEDFKERVLIKFLNEYNLLVLLDGFDEITFLNRRDIVIREFEKLVGNVEKSKIILTSRTSDFRFSIPNINVFEICPLTEIQISTFAHKWLESEIDANDFIEKIKKSPFADTAIRPLTIAHLCALYERNKDIPEKPKTVYRKIVMLLLEEWNQQRNVRRVSKYAKFEADRQFDFLSSLAYNLTISYKANQFTNSDLQTVYNKIFQDFDLLRNEMIIVINELESHNGLILQCGFEDFQFAHKSIQEYLTAEYIVKLPSIPNNRNIIQRLPNEIAIAIAISSKPSDYFNEFINEKLIPMNLNNQFIKPFINRLLLEKVDFNKNSFVAVSVLNLYSSYLKSIDHQQLLLFYSDDLIIEFEKLIEGVFNRNDKQKFFSNYRILNTLSSSSGDDIYILELRKDILKKLPKKLYCRESFVKDIEPLLRMSLY